jgi:hypothetical protein
MEIGVSFTNRDIKCGSPGEKKSDISITISRWGFSITQQFTPECRFMKNANIRPHKIFCSNVHSIIGHISQSRNQFILCRNNLESNE